MRIIILIIALPLVILTGSNDLNHEHKDRYHSVKDMAKELLKRSKND
jgi:hypothetical protein